MKDRVKYACLITITILIVCTILLVVSDNQTDSSNNQKDYIGHWYLISEDGINYEDEYYSITFHNEESYLFGLDILKIHNGAFNGKLYDEYFTGVLFENTISFRINRPAGLVYCEGTIENDILTLHLFMNFPDGNPHTDDVEVAIAVYSKNLIEKSIDEDWKNYTGSWKCKTADIQHYDRVETIEPVDVTITSQNKSIFTGFMFGPDGRIDFKGCFSKEGKNVYGFIMNETNIVYKIFIMNNTMTMSSIHNQEESVLEYILTKDGIEESVEKENMFEKQYFSAYLNVTICIDGKVTEPLMKSNITIEYRNTNLCALSVVYGNDAYKTMAVLTKVNGLYCLEWNIFGKYYHATVDFDRQIAIVNNTDEEGSTWVALLNSPEYENSSNSGHWYATYVNGFGTDGKKYSLDVNDGAILDIYDLDIYEIENNLIYMKFCDRLMSGTISNDKISVILENDKESTYIFGYVEGSNTITLATVREYTDGTLESHVTHLSRNYTTTYVENDMQELLKTLKLAYGLDYNGMPIPSDDMSITITDVIGSVFKGVYVNEITKEKIMINGNVFKTEKEYALGLAIDSNGQEWIISWKSDMMKMKSCSIRENECYANLLVFSETGTGDTDINALPMKGNWIATSRNVVTSNGKFLTMNTPLTLTFESEYKGLSVGKWTDGYYTGTMAATSIGAYIDAPLQFKYLWNDGSTSTAVGWLLDEDHIIMIESYVDVYGEAVTQESYLERVT